MIDIHCHILHDIDDGAANLEEALTMAKMAVASGVTDMIATPHFRGELGYLELLHEIKRRHWELSQALERWGVPLQLHIGAEILCLNETPELARRRKLPTLAGTNYVLTEFFFDEDFLYMDNILSGIAENGYVPVVAHPERYGAIQYDPMLTERWVEAGYVLQINKGSILGSLGKGAEEAAHALLELGNAHLFASDGHSSYSRTPHMGRLQRWMEEYCDMHTAEIFLEENPRRVLRNLPMLGD
jgi:protein-tyrosine phosphatase